MNDDSKKLVRDLSPDGVVQHDSLYGLSERNSWPPKLQCAYDICMQSKLPMSICVVQNGTLFFNNAWAELLGTSSTLSAGAGRDVYGEQWEIVDAAIAKAIDAGETLRCERQLFGKAHSHHHEGYFNYQLQPLRLEQGDAVLIFAERSYEEVEKHHDEFLATIAHELRNPFSALAAAAQVLNKAVDRPQMMATARDALTRQIGYLAQLLDDLLDVSRLRRERLEIRRQPVSLKDVIAASMLAAKPALENRQHNFVVEEPDTLLRVSGDKHMLIKVFSNLLNHVAKYTESGRPLQLQTVAHETDIDVIIRNTSFVPEAIQRAIRDCLDGKFTRQLGKDLDLGLYLICGLVRLHGGEISVQHDAGTNGTDLIVRLPRTQVHFTQQQAATTTP